MYDNKLLKKKKKIRNNYEKIRYFYISRKSNIEEIKKYIEKMSKIGASRIFSCLLSVNKDIEDIKSDFLEIHNYAKSLGYEIILDII